MKIIKQDMSVWINNSLVWYKNELRHREDGPASMWSYGEEFYYLEGNAYIKNDYWKEVHENY